ncbi:MAG: carboxypeptidase-like regulatory domain-containing protein, partial [Cyclobacteriaceae bacterium]|nr:carboxypeptidase-like regulatory domain-containing protein [Cyclobacteriaceae bacterium]
MRKYFFVLGLLFVLAPLKAQENTAFLKGRVIDKESNEGLPFANVFVNHTTLGTSTNGA